MTIARKKKAWLILAAVFILAEIMSLGLTSIWFAGGALAGLTASVLGGSTRLQLGVFVAVSFLLLLLVRPLEGAGRVKAAPGIGTEGKNEK